MALARSAEWIGVAFVVAVVPLLLLGISHLGVRDYVGGGLLIFGAAAVGHLGLELMALGRRDEEGT